MKVDFSIILCCYKSDFQKFKNTFISCVKQKGVSFEIIIAEDGTATLEQKNEIIEWTKKFTEVNVKYSFLEKNSGTVINVREALKQSEGKYAKMISPGDYFYDEYVLMSAKKSFENKKTDLVFGNVVYYNEDKILDTICPNNKLILKNKLVKEASLFVCDYFVGSSIIAKIELWNEYINIVAGKVKYVEDVTMLTFSLINKRKLDVLEKPIVWYEYSTGISTNINTYKMVITDINNLFDCIYENYPSNLTKRIKKVRGCKNESLLKKVITISIYNPFYYIYLITKVFNRKIKENYNILNLKKIIEE